MLDNEHCQFEVKGIAQWFSTFFTHLTFSSNKITRFTPNKLSGAHFLKIQN